MTKLPDELTVSFQGTPLRFSRNVSDRDYDADTEFRKDHIESARFAVHVSLANFLKLLKVPSEGREQCWAEVSAILRTYEPS